MLAAPAGATKPAPSCSLELVGGKITDTLTGLRTSGGTYEWDIAVLDEPSGAQQTWYFRPGPSSFTASFAYAGPGSYVGELWLTTDNMRGPAKFTHLATRCSLTL